MNILLDAGVGVIIAAALAVYIRKIKSKMRRFILRKM